MPAPSLYALPLPAVSARRARHARPGVLSRPAVRRAALATGMVGVLAVPVTGALLAGSPASAAPYGIGALALLPASGAVDQLAVAGLVAQAAPAAQAAQPAAQVAAAAQAAAAQQLAAQVVDPHALDAVAQASRSRDLAAVVPVASSDPRSIAQEMLAARGQAGQFSCLDSLWSKESGWSTSAANPSSDAYGIPQALPGSKMASAGPDWRTNARTQITWGLGYIEARYGSPCAAWSHSRAANWY